MSDMRLVQLTAAALLCLALASGQRSASAATAVQAADGPPAVSDVALGPGGTLRGLAVTPEGVPSREVAVTLWERDKELGRATTDPLGRFSLGNLHGGVYQLKAGSCSYAYRAWLPGTAPPDARPLAVVIVDAQTIVRGQSPSGGGNVLRRAAVATVVAGAIAVPIVYSTMSSGNRVPVSP